jgi:starch-binding outer membrane protein, SusD/RagB family
VNTAKRFALLGVLALAGTTGACNNFLTGGELSNDPNRPTSGTPQSRFEATQPALWALLSSDLARVTSVWMQQLEGINFQYTSVNIYVHDESTTGGLEAGLYTGGGLVDLREVEKESLASGDSLLLGQAQVVEAFTMGTGADLFGDLVYSQALTGTPNPTLDNQLDVYDAVQTLLSSAITNLGATGPTNFGAGPSDLAFYAGTSVANKATQTRRWIQLAHTLKARFYLHTAEVRPAAYANALTEAQLGITASADDYKAIWSGSLGEQNYWFQFFVNQRAGYIVPNSFFVSLLQSTSDPRLGQYFNGTQTDLSGARLDPTFSQPLVTAQEDLLIWSEAAYRTSDPGTALTKLNDERAIAGAPAVSASGPALLQAILTEKYIAEFQNIEAYNDYKRTCFPNLTPTVTGLIIPARFFYDTSERQTDTNIPDPAAQPTRNANDPANATDDFGNACKGQTP